GVTFEVSVHLLNNLLKQQAGRTRGRCRPACFRVAATVFSYVAYGLGINSEIALPELEAGGGSRDVIVRLDSTVAPPEIEGPVRFAFEDAETVCIRSRMAGEFRVRRGREVVISPTAEADENLLRLFVLGPALALLLYQRGLLVLHASAAALAGGAVAFLGYSGRGKSTTAAALHARGHRLVADDVVAVENGTDGPPNVWPGFPQLKLWPEVVGSLGVEPESLRRLHHSFDKRARRVSEGFSPEPLPLKRLYVLAEADSYGAELLAPQDAVIELVRHSYGVRLLSTRPGGEHFSRCADLAKRMPVYRLHRPRKLDELATLAEFIERDAAGANLL
ncbi:MAG: hypothetical protein M3348_02970, partial [Acidobacteriota bacterium]|nr:hypothetical protein [Acidobacteriota bacterium]